MTPELRAAALGDHIDRLYRAAWAITGAREDAEDLVQETFERVLRRPREIAREEDTLPYLLGVLRNTWVDIVDEGRDGPPRRWTPRPQGGSRRPPGPRPQSSS